MTYIGRFAPSPTGLLHFGSLLAATASYLEARRQHGLWHVRMEDLDQARMQAGAASTILYTLEQYGFQWDGAVHYQSQRLNAYAEALSSLAAHSYACTCSRKQLRQQATPGPYGLIYPGTCRTQQGQTPLTQQQAAIRITVPKQTISFTDAIQGIFSQHLAYELGDFVIRRADGIYAYQLAVVVDDAWQGITHIVRGADLLDNTPRQIYLQQLLGLPQPHYSHVPIAIYANGQKLSKQTQAPAITPQARMSELCKALSFLGQQVPEPSAFAHIEDLWQWAIQHWHPAQIPQQYSRLLPNTLS